MSDFLGSPVPQDKFWMTRYFTGSMSYEFLRYFLLFRSSAHFSEHVGRPCSSRWVKRMRSRFKRIEGEHAKAKSDMDFERVADIEMGGLKLR